MFRRRRCNQNPEATRPLSAHIMPTLCGSYLQPNHISPPDDEITTPQVGNKHVAACAIGLPGHTVSAVQHYICIGRAVRSAARVEGVVAKVVWVHNWKIDDFVYFKSGFGAGGPLLENIRFCLF